MPIPASSIITTAPVLPETRRLHVTPLTAALLPKVLGNSLHLAQDVSFHQLPNFPERGYGFITLPAAEAAMVKKKLHGTILRGQKVVIEDARPDVRKEKAESERQEGAEAISEPEPRGRTLRKRKREDGVIAGSAELPRDRKVKRGWTEPKAAIEARKIKEKREKKESKGEKKSKETKSKASSFTDKEECLFQTAVPEASAQVRKSRDNKQPNRKSKKSKQLTTVHEFEHSTKYPSYLRQTPSKDKKVVQEYNEDKGWVDEDGNTIETATRSARRRKANELAQGRVREELELGAAAEDKLDDETSSSGSSSGSEESDAIESESETGEAEPSIVKKELTIGAEPEVSITEPSPVTPHPLETLFKKPKPPIGENSTRSSLEINTSFSFFGGKDDDEHADRPAIEKSLETPGLPALRRRGLPNLSIPVTPYTQRDIQWRSQRSAAPTPDTAAPSKSSFGDPFGILASIHKDTEGAIEEEVEDEDEQDNVMQGIEHDDSALDPSTQSHARSDGGKESEFAKWFWENRGANTRAWKKRKGEAMKEQKNRESRRRKP